MALLLAGKLKAFQIAKTRFNRTFSSSVAPKIKTLRTTFVKPYKQLGRKDCQLITFDLQCLTFEYIQRLFIYKCGNHELEKVEEKLKDGLRDVLKDFYPLAGKIGKDDEGILRVEYDDDMDGVEVKIATAEDTHVEDLDHKVVGTYKEFVPYNSVCNLEGFHRSLLAVQARNTRVKVSLPLASKAPIDSPLISKRCFSNSESTIDHIKSNINKHITKTTKPFSTFTCVATHVWREITRARQLKPEDVTVLYVGKNLRSRLDPPMPERYFGNLVQCAVTATTARVLSDSPQETCASLIKQAIEMHDSNTINTVATEWERIGKPLQVPDFGRNAVVIGSSPKFKVYELDFGWGKPEMVTSGCNNRSNGVVFLHQGKCGGQNIDIDVSLEDQVMKRLEMDEEFLMQNS